jgi:hypothetical protein
MTNLSKLAATGTRLDLALAAARDEVKVTILPAGKPPKGLATANRVGGGGTRWQPTVRAGHANRRLKGGDPVR